MLESSKSTKSRDKILGILVTLLVIGIIAGMLYGGGKLIATKNQLHAGLGFPLVFVAFPITPIIVGSLVHTKLEYRDNLNLYAMVIYGFIAPAVYGWNREKCISDGVTKYERELRALEPQK